MPTSTPGPDQDGRRPDNLLSDLRALRRARDGRVIAGVCAGVGRQLGVDPVVLRVGLAVLALFGGVGVLLYAGGWLLLPGEDEPRSILEQQLGRRTNGSPDNAVLIGGLVVLGLVVLSVPWWGLPWHVPTLLVLSVVGLVALVRRQTDQDGGSSNAAAPDDPAGAPAGGGPAPGVTPGSAPGTAPPSTAGSAGGIGTPANPPTSVLPTDSASASAPPSEAVTAALPASDVGDLAGSPTGSWRDAQPAPPAFWNQPDPLGLGIDAVTLDAPPEGWDPPAPTAPPERQRRSWLFAGTAAMTLVVLGVLSAADGARQDLPSAAYVAAALGTVGLGLVVGTWFGRSRGLVATGVVLALALVPASAVDAWPDGTVDASFRPTTVDAIRPSYEYGAGNLVLDLSEVDFQDDDEVRTAVDVGAGDVTVMLPPNVDLEFSGDVGLGDMTSLDLARRGFGGELEREFEPPRDAPVPGVPDGPRFRDGGSESGVGLSRAFTDRGPDGKGGGTLHLDVDLGVGQLELHRVF